MRPSLTREPVQLNLRFFEPNMANLKRIYLLPEAEIADLYARPVFNKSEQSLYFEMNQAELDLLRQFGTTRTKVYFILQLAYFKAKNQFL